MGTQWPEIFAKLSAPFDSNEVRERPGGRGSMLKYITARTAMNRLDTVLGPEKWEDTYTETRDGFMCRLTITLPDGSKVSKMDGGGFADMPEEDNCEKSGYSDAFKRVCVKFGIGRYLYRDGVPRFDALASTPQSVAHGQQSRQSDTRERVTVTPVPGTGRPPGEPPRDGRGLYAWICDLDKRTQADPPMIKQVNGWAKDKNLPFKMVQWDQGQVAECWAEFGFAEIDRDSR